MTRQSRDTKRFISSICREFYQIIHLTRLSPGTFSSVMHVWSSAISIICREMKLLLPLRNILSHFDVHRNRISFEPCTGIKAKDEKLNAKTFYPSRLKRKSCFTVKACQRQSMILMKTSLEFSMEGFHVLCK